MKYKVGDKVRVKNNLQDDVFYGKVPYAKTMEKYKGEVLTIDSISKEYYFVKEDYGKFKWTDEMLEPVEEMSAEEATKILGEICCENDRCAGCPISEAKGEMLCQNFRRDKAEEVLEILKQWKKDHEKKEVEVEFVWYAVIMDEKRNVVYEEKTNETIITSDMKEEVLKKYCSEHDGKYYAISERRCVVKE